MHAIPAKEEAAAEQIADLVFGVERSAEEGESDNQAPEGETP
jgi:hypothetical protein